MWALNPWAISNLYAPWSKGVTLINSIFSYGRERTVAFAAYGKHVCILLLRHKDIFLSSI